MTFWKSCYQTRVRSSSNGSRRRCGDKPVSSAAAAGEGGGTTGYAVVVVAARLPPPGGNARWLSRNAEDVRMCIGTNAVANRYLRTYAFRRHRHTGVYVAFSRFFRSVFVCELTTVFLFVFILVFSTHARTHTQTYRGRRRRVRHPSWCFTRPSRTPFLRVVIPYTDAPTSAVRTRASTQRYACCSVRYAPSKTSDGAGE